MSLKKLKSSFCSVPLCDCNCKLVCYFKCVANFWCDVFGGPVALKLKVLQQLYRLVLVCEFKLE